MILEIIFGVYLLIFELLTIWLGINFTRIRQKYGVHPRIPSFILPLFLNYLLGNNVFTGIPTFFAVLLPCILSLVITLKFQKVRILGITGSIATGKSTLTRLIRDNFKEIDIIDCDQISRKLRKKGQPGYDLIVSLLGDKAEEYLNPLTRQIEEQQRKKLNEFVFKNKSFRDKLTKKMGQLIIMRVFKTIFMNIITGKNHMLVDAPLLYETKILTYICFPIIVVGCSEQTQISRLMQRDGYTQQQAKTRIASQMPLTEKIKRAEIYLSNQGTQASLLQQFSSKIKRYLSSKMSKIYMVDPRYSAQKKSQLRREAQPE